MAEFQIAVKYQPPSLKNAFLLMCVMLPVWSILLPLGFGIGMTWFFMNLSGAVAPVAFTFAMFCLALYLVGYTASAASEDKFIHVQKEGIAMPLFMLPVLAFRRMQPWQNLKAAHIVTSDNNKVLLLTFDGPRTVKLNVNHLDKEKLESFLLSLELWAKGCQRSPELIAYQTELQVEAGKGGGLSYTHIWQDELSRRFATTSFIPLEPDQTLQNGRLKIVRQLAFGGFSAVYLAQRNGHEQVVLKEAVVPDNADPKEKEAAESHLKRESVMLFGIKHPGIARVEDYFVEDGRYYLVMEYVSGQDLRQMVRQHGVQSQEKTINYALQAAEVLNYLHHLDPPIIHRDLSPDNLVLDNEGNLKVIDFGASNEFVGTATGTLIGKQAYMAPEQIRGKATPASDVYALGATIYYLLTGKEPKPLTPAHPKVLAPEVSEELDALVAKCTAFEPEERVKTAQAVIDMLKSIQ
ncbi:MAG: serine/threonine protein kinase [Candidatus Obscuribacterales bacterium]|nr:serine/threonine protein kinase [Candidatus Obscuribacterales bacterium]